VSDKELVPARDGSSLKKKKDETNPNKKTFRTSFIGVVNFSLSTVRY